MRNLILLIALAMVAGCSSIPEPRPIPVIRSEIEILENAGYARLGERDWRSETIWRKYIHTCTGVYAADIICSGSTSVGRLYGVLIIRWVDGNPVKVYGSGGAKIPTIHGAVETTHREIARHEASENEVWRSAQFGSPTGSPPGETVGK